jgi:hypothetical protein
MKSIKTIGLIALLTILQIIAMTITIQVIKLGPDFALTPEDASQAATMFLFVSIINSFLILFFFRKVNNKDYKLIFWFIYIWFGLGTFLPQTDTWYFMDAFPLIDYNILIKIISMGLINSILIIPICFFITSRKSNEAIDLQINKVHNLKIIKYLLLISVIYVILYYLAGYFIAWQFDAIRIHYSGTIDKLSFFDHTRQLLINDPYFFPFQLMRGVLWFFIGIPLFIIFIKNKKESLIFSFFIFAILPSIQLFLPNPLMSEAVRMGHFIEGFISMGIFGVIAALIWQRYDSQLSNSFGSK